MRGFMLACSLLSVSVLGGCAGSGSRISVITSADKASEIGDCPQFRQFCAHGLPLSAEGLALIGPESGDARVVGAEPVGLTTFGPVQRPRSSRPGVYFLGAGDSLGQAIFGAYAMFARAERPRELNGIDQPDDAIVSGVPVGE